MKADDQAHDYSMYVVPSALNAISCTCVCFYFMKFYMFEWLQNSEALKTTHGGCSPTLCFPSFKNNTWILKLGGSFGNTLCTNPKEITTI